MDTSNQTNGTPTLTFEYEDGGTTFVALTRAPAGSVGTIVRRKKQRGRPVYQAVGSFLIPAGAAVITEVHPVAANLLNDA